MVFYGKLERITYSSGGTILQATINNVAVNNPQMLYANRLMGLMLIANGRYIGQIMSNTKLTSGTIIVKLYPWTLAESIPVYSNNPQTQPYGIGGKVGFTFLSPIGRVNDRMVPVVIKTAPRDDSFTKSFQVDTKSQPVLDYSRKYTVSLKTPFASPAVTDFNTLMRVGVYVETK